MFILGALIMAVSICLLALVTANFDPYLAAMMYIDLVGTFGFIVVMVGVVVATGGFKTLIAAVNALFSKKYNISAADKEKSIKLFKLLGKSVLSASLLFAVMGLTSILTQLGDLSVIGLQIALALNSIFQGLCINLVLIHPAVNVLQARYNAEEKTVISEKQVINKLLELCYKQGVSPEEILKADEVRFFKR